MKNAPIRVLVIIAIVSLIGIIGTQVYWLNRAIEQQDQVFNHNVQVALRNVVESLCEANGKDFPTVNPIEQVSGNYFIVRTNDRIDITNLEYLISAEIKKRAISQDFEYGVYDCANDQMVYADNVSLKNQANSPAIPVLQNEEYYFGVYFPEKAKNLFAGFDLWKFTTLITLVVIGFFGYALFVILRQKRLSEVQRDFINNVSHELKTPLATLALASTTLHERSAEKDNKYLTIINNEVARLHKNVEDILEASFIESKRPIQKAPLQLDQFLNTLTEGFKSEYASKLISWDLTGEANRAIFSNEKLLEKCIRNLVDNAIKYGGKHIKIAFSQDQNQTVISVADDGPGIPKEHLKKIFKKFYRVPESQHQHNQKGFGLGLHIVKSAVQNLGGKVGVESKIDVGSTFKIILNG
ncbi:two-component system, OmpR family, phosphate regulon sensor histidine kinase PhoR [Ekhidna lutea]|uniref:histidine kinase n=1 Tax=Ekhidna lutea TaxID=447679 RepID=A0A239IDX6_EKHLU|nr:HAMP domain-containing sensor histidine kinase [Ekhidna lutea]SNS91765.1 two-component system, OmpR family, phosphate regulon sensor histidine kinase PhoR [Ekhidna lutea]